VKQRWVVVQEAANFSDEDEAAGGDSDDDWLAEHNQTTADGHQMQVAKVVLKV